MWLGEDYYALACVVLGRRTVAIRLPRPHPRAQSTLGKFQSCSSKIPLILADRSGNTGRLEARHPRPRGRGEASSVVLEAAYGVHKFVRRRADCLRDKRKLQACSYNYVI